MSSDEGVNPYFFELARKQLDCYVEHGKKQIAVESGEDIGACTFCIVDEGGQKRVCTANNFRVEFSLETGEPERIVWDGDCLYRELSDELLEQL